MASCGGLDVLGQHRERARNRTGARERASRKLARHARAGRGLEQDGVAGSEGMERMNAGQEKADNFPARSRARRRTAGDEPQMKRPASRADVLVFHSDAMRARCAALLVRASGKHRRTGELRQASFSATGRSLDRGGRDGERLGVRRDEVAKFADESQPIRDRLRAPIAVDASRVFRARRQCARSLVRRSMTACITAGSRFMGANCGAGVRVSLRMEVSPRSARGASAC